MDDVITQPRQATRLSAKDEILALARQHGVSYEPTELDQLADDMARLSGEDGKLDEVEEILLALERAGKISTPEADRFHVAYMRQHTL